MSAAPVVHVVVSGLATGSIYALVATTNSDIATVTSSDSSRMTPSAVRALRGAVPAQGRTAALGRSGWGS
jgi:hypothetical protein